MSILEMLTRNETHTLADWLKQADDPDTMHAMDVRRLHGEHADIANHINHLLDSFQDQDIAIRIAAFFSVSAFPHGA